MNIDERLEKLAEHTDAIAQSVELLASMQIETERRMARLAEVSTQLEEGMARVANILVSHDQRIDRLEGNRPQ